MPDTRVRDRRLAASSSSGHANVPERTERQVHMPAASYPPSTATLWGEAGSVSIERAWETSGATDFAATNIIVVVKVLPARVEWLEALSEGDEAFTARFGIPVVEGWVGFPEALAAAVDGARRRSEDPWGTHLFFDDDGALVGFGGFKGEPNDGEVELGYAVAPERRGRGVATAVVEQLVNRAHTAGVNVVSAHTLAEENASTAVLRKCGFVRTGQLHDSSRDVWRWERADATSE